MWNPRQIFLCNSSFCGVVGKPLRKVGVTRRDGIRQSEQMHLIQTGQTWQMRMGEQPRQKAPLQH